MEETPKKKIDKHFPKKLTGGVGALTEGALSKYILEKKYKGDIHKLSYDVGQSKKKIEEGTIEIDFQNKTIKGYFNNKDIQKYGFAELLRRKLQGEEIE